MKNLILFTRNFPYSPSETTFINNELPFLLEKFDRIFTICTFGISGQKALIELPNKVLLINEYRHTKFLSHVVYPFGAIKHIFDNDKRWKQIKKYEKSNLKNKMYYGYDLTRAEYRMQKIIEKIRNLNLDPEDTIMYSFWFNDVAYIASLVNDKIFNGQCKIISRAHRFDLYDDRSSFADCLKSLAIDKVNAIYACSNQGCNYLSKKFPEYKEKIFSSYLGTVDYGKTIGQKDGSFRICSCSYIKDVKRVDLILEALSKVNSPELKIEWSHYGDGSGQAPFYQQMANEMLPENIKATFYGQIDNTELIKIYKNQRFDLFINVSSSEGLPVSIMEATSFGMPVVATDVGGTSEIVGEDNGALLECEFTINELTDLIVKFAYMDNVNIEKYRSASRRKWEDNFNSANNYKRFAKILSE